MSDIPRDEEASGEIEEDEITEADAPLDDEGEIDPDAPDDEGQEGEEEPERVLEQPRETRRQRREREYRELREEVQRLKAQPPQTHQQPQYSPEAIRQAQLAAQAREQEMLEQMTPVQVSQYQYEKGRQEFGAVLRQMQDQTDAREFARSAQTDPAAARLHSKVEQIIAMQRAKGDFVTDRETALTWAVGWEIRHGTAKATQKQARAGQRRIAAQTTRPANVRGDGTRQARTTARDADEALLRNTRMSDL